MKMETQQQITQIEIKKIIPNSLQPRKEFDKKRIKELAESIKSVGLINPIQVKKISDSDEKNDRYEIVCGERRFRACKILKLKTINAIVKTYEKGKEKNEMIESLVENLQRTKLNSVERENYITTLWEVGKFKSHRELAKFIGVSESVIQSNLKAKKIRDKHNLAKDITTRDIYETIGLEKNDLKNILKNIKNKNIEKQKIREYVKVLKNTDEDIKQSLFKNDINIKQAEKISKIQNPNIKKEVLKAHKEIKKIDKDIEKSILKKVKNKNQNNLVQVNETLSTFRQNIVEVQNKNQSTIKSFLKCISIINLMDKKQMDKLKYNLELLESNIDNMLNVLERANNEVKNYS